MTEGHETDGRTLAQFFFEVGYGACYADAFIKNGEKVPFELTDAIVERAWAIVPECYEDCAEMDARKALADAAPDLLEALVNLVNSFEKHRPKEYWDAARAAISKAGGQS